jgi:hypothetical protein
MAAMFCGILVDLAICDMTKIVSPVSRALLAIFVHRCATLTNTDRVQMTVQATIVITAITATPVPSISRWDRQLTDRTARGEPLILLRLGNTLRCARLWQCGGERAQQVVQVIGGDA